MDKNTVVRIAIPLSLYESVKGKVLNESSTSSNPEIKKLEKELFDALNDPKITALIQKGIAKMKPEDKEELAKVTMSEGEGGDFSSFKSMVDKFVDKAPMKEFGTHYSISDLESSEDKSKSELSKAAGTIIKNAGKANLMSMGFLPSILAIITDYIGGTHIVDTVGKAVGDGSVAAILSVAGGLLAGGVLWKIGSMLKGEKISGDEPLFEAIKKFIKQDAKKVAKKKTTDKKATDIKEEKKEPSKEDAELIAKMEKMAKSSDPGKAYAAELFLKTLKKKKAKA
jgi:hypothetical protein